MLNYKNLSLKFKEHCIFDNLSGQLSRGEFVGIFGPNGTGKSSFLRCLASLEDPTTGEISWDDTPLSQHSLVELAAIRSYMHVEVSCAWDLTLKEMSQLYPKKSISHQKQVFDDLKCDFPSEKKFLSFSSGEKSLFLLGLALSNDSPLILLDEMTAMLDEKKTRHVLGALRSKAAEGKAIVLILHDKLMAEQYCHRLLYFQ